LDGLVSLQPPPHEQPTGPEPAQSRSWRHDLIVATIIIVALELAAFPIGLLWGHVAQHVQYSHGPTSLDLVVGDAKPLVREDGWFLVITGGAGIVSGVVIFFLAKRAEIGATLGLAIGGLAAGWLAWRVGHAWTGGLQPIALALKPVDTKAKLAADLGARVVLISWAVAAVAVHGLLYALTWPAKPKVEPAPAPAAEPLPAPSGPPVAEV
jgi:hypothetical protein